MNLDKRILRVCQECAMKHINDIEEALSETKRRLKVPPLQPWILALVDNALREQIHIARHISNGKLRRMHCGPGKVGASSALDAIAESVYQQSVLNHTIAGWLLGDIAKTDLPLFAEAEDEKAAGSLFNAGVCRECYQVCCKRNGETVRECMKEAEVEAVFKKIAKQLGRDAG